MNGISDQNASSNSVDLKALFAFLYLATPFFLFYAGWFKLPVALLATALFITLTALAIFWIKIQWRHPQHLASYLPLLLVALAWAYFGGAGHFSYSSTDWLVRDAVYGDLIDTPWPPAYENMQGATLLLRSALGYYLAPAALSKIFGLDLADTFLFIWTALGATLFLSLLPRQKTFIRSALALLLVIFFSGMDALGALLVSGNWPLFPMSTEWWTALSYPSFTGQLYWGPNHALPLWIITALFYRHWQSPGFCYLVFPTMVIGTVWTPFIIPGLAPFLIYLFIHHLRRGTLSLPRMLILAGISLLIAYPMLRLFTLGLESVSSPVAPLEKAHPNAPTAFLLQIYAPFVLMEFAILALILFKSLKDEDRIFWAIAFTILLALPFLSFGPSNDLLLRVSTPSLILLMIFTGKMLFQDSWHTLALQKWMVLGVLLLGALTPLHEIYRAASRIARSANYTFNLQEQQKGVVPGHYATAQKRPDLEFLLRQPAIVRNSTQRSHMSQPQGN